MNLFVYSDESGVFDNKHYKYFVFGGLIFLDKTARDIASRKYSKAENDIRSNEKIPNNIEIKATTISNKNKGKLFRSLNNIYKFGIIIDQGKLLQKIYTNKKDKQRYLDFAYKLGLKRTFQKMIDEHIILPNNVENIYCYMDEHSTATNGRYELKEALEQEFKYGTFNWNYMIHYKPIFTNLSSIDVKFRDSKSNLLVRASDIVANKIYYCVNTNNPIECIRHNIYINNLP